jgi:hypothetical protein
MGGGYDASARSPTFAILNFFSSKRSARN